MKKMCKKKKKGGTPQVLFSLFFLDDGREEERREEVFKARFLVLEIGFCLVHCQARRSSI